MTAEERTAFLNRFAEDYDLPGAAARAGITRGAAYALLREDSARAIVDEQICARRSGAALARIVREYERMAFGGDEDAKPGDRLRALEQLRLIASADAKNGAAPTLTIRCEYV